MGTEWNSNALPENIQDISIVSRSYDSFALQEIEYRKTGEMKMTPADALKDTLDTCLIFQREDVVRKMNAATPC